MRQSNTSHDLKGIIVDSVTSVPIDSIENSECASVTSNQVDGYDVPHKITEDPVTMPQSYCGLSAEASDADGATSGCNSPFYQLRKDATAFVAHTLERGRRNVWQLTSSRVSVLLSSSAICSTSTYQFLRNYEDLNIFILAGEAFCGAKAVEFRQKLKTTCESYLASFHRQNVYVCNTTLVFSSFNILS